MSTANLNELQLIVRDAIAAAASVSANELSPERDVFELGLDSLDFWAILMDVEEQVGRQVPSEVLDRLAEIDGVVSVGRLLDVVSSWNLAADSAHD